MYENISTLQSSMNVNAEIKPSAESLAMLVRGDHIENFSMKYFPMQILQMQKHTIYWVIMVHS